MHIRLYILGICSLLATFLPGSAIAQFFEYQSNAVLLKYSDRYEIPFTGETDQENGVIFTFQHADGWKYGDNFGFVDFSDKDQTGSDIYGEFYANFSLGKMTGKHVGFWRVKDMGILAGINAGRETKLLKWLPGFRLSWDVPGFAFLNTDFTLYIDDSRGAAAGGVPKETDSYMIDVNFLSDFDIGRHGFSIEGHIEYISERENEFGEKVDWWILSQPRFMYDLGKIWLEKPNHLYVGIEWQVWIHQAGDPDTNENAPQLILVGRF